MITKRLLFTTLLVIAAWSVFGQAKGIDTTTTYHIGGIKQFVSIQGADSTKPLLLFITGGPGESSIGKSDVFTNELKKHFVLVEWDQRQCGETFKLNKSPQPITLALCESDARQITDTLLARFHRPKLFVLGWSWGTSLGFYLAKNYPEKLYAYMAVSPVINQLESERISLRMMTEKARKTNNQKALDELAKVRIPFENMDDAFYDRKWMFFFDGQQIDDKFLKDYFADPDRAWIMPLFVEASKQNLMDEPANYKCPIYFFVGKNDYQTNHTISENYFNKLTAPKKQLFLFQNSRHAVPYMETELFESDIINKVLPELEFK